MDKNRPYGEYLFRTFKWLTTNIIFGLFPLLFMCMIQKVTDGKVGGMEIEHFMADGVVLFVWCAIMGSVAVDFFLAGYRLGSFEIFAYYFAPFCILLFVTLQYLLIRLHVITSECFEMWSFSSIFIQV